MTKTPESAKFHPHGGVRGILFLLLGIALAFPLINTLYLHPRFVQEMLDDTEDDAIRATRYIIGRLHFQDTPLDKEKFPSAFEGEAQAIKKHFKLWKLQVFSPSGEVVYSTDPADVGDINAKPYFAEKVAKGEVVTKLVAKNAKTSEEQIVPVDVVEIYVPLMKGDVFLGAFEVYYDITERKQRIEALTSRTSTIALGIVAMLLAALAFFSWKSKEPQAHSVSTTARVSPRVYLVVAGAVIFVFSAYEVVERTWLSGLSMRWIHVLHIARGVATAILAALLAGWHILRSRPSIFPSEAPKSAYPEQEASRDEDRSLHFARWLIRMRWLACVISAVLVIATVEVLEYLPRDETFWPLALSVAWLACSNLLFDQFLRRRWLVRHLLELQIVSDLVVFTVMLHYSGGIENPLLFAYLFHVIIAGILLSRRRCYATVALATVLLAAMAFAELGEVVEHYKLSVFPHGAGEKEELQHAAHDSTYVVCVVALQFGLLSLSAYFVTTIVERLRAQERRALADRQRLERVVHAAGAGLIILNKELRPIWTNDQVKRWLNLPGGRAGLLSPRLAEWSGGKNGPASRTIKDGLVRTMERQLGGGGGAKRTFQITIAPLLDSSGNAYQIVELVQDITQHKLVEAEMMHSAKMAVLGSMAAGIAHEVGNPLASLSTRIRLLQRPHDEVFLRESLGLLHEQIDRIARIVRGVSQFARPAKEEWSACRINDIVEETLTVLEFHHLAKSTDIRTKLSEGLPEIMAAKDQLTQIFLNLALNAIEAMSQGGTLTVATYSDGETVSIAFADTGQGMDEETRANIFAPFFSTKNNGLGLGLSIVHNMVSAHGGRIQVESRPGKGSLFTVILPVRISERADKDRGEDLRS